MLLETLLNFLTGAALAGLIGAERELVQRSYRGATHQDERKLFGGIRTHILISLLGGILTYVGVQYAAHWLIAVGFVVLSAFLIINYTHNLFRKDHQGFTTELTGLVTYMLGVLCQLGFANLAAILGILATITLVAKTYLSQTLEKVERQELYNTLKFAVILFVILPVLPATPIDSWGLVNLQKVWKVVVIISGVSYVGYLLNKIIGTSKGIAFSGVLGGLASSTATTSSMAEQSKKHTHILYPFVIATIAASAMMFFRVIFLVASYNKDILPSLLIPMVGMGVVGGGFVLYSIYKTKDHQEDNSSESPDLESPFQILPALKFALFFLFVSSISHITQQHFGNEGTYIVAALSGLADVDAITIALATQTLAGAISTETASTGILIAVIVNTIVKMIIAKAFGGKQFGNMIVLSFISTIIVGALLIITF